MSAAVLPPFLSMGAQTSHEQMVLLHAPRVSPVTAKCPTGVFGWGDRVLKSRFHWTDDLSRLRGDKGQRDVADRSQLARQAFDHRLSLKETVARASMYLFCLVALWGVTYLCLVAAELLRP